MVPAPPSRPFLDLVVFTFTLFSNYSAYDGWRSLTRVRVYHVIVNDCMLDKCLMSQHSSRRGRGSTFTQINTGGSTGVHIRTLSRRYRLQNEGDQALHHRVPNAQLAAQREKERSLRRSQLQSMYVLNYLAKNITTSFLVFKCSLLLHGRLPYR
jgi:hypothetical protein